MKLFSPLVVCAMLPPFCTNCALFQAPQEPPKQATDTVASSDIDAQRFVPYDAEDDGCSEAPEGAVGCFQDLADGQVCCGQQTLGEMGDGSTWACVYAFCRDECDAEWKLLEFECSRVGEAEAAPEVEL